MAPNRRSITMADFAADISDLKDLPKTYSILLYGDPGTGKTALASGLPNSLLLACDPGYVTAQVMGHRPAIRKIPNYETLQAGLAWLEDGNYANYEWVILDGGTVLQQRMVQQFARDAWEADNTKRASSMQPDKPDYFKSQNAIKSTVARLVDLPVNTIITAHVMHGETENGDGTIRPHWEGRDYMVGNNINALPNCIGYMYPKLVEEGRGTNKRTRQIRRILWQETVHPETGTIYTAKDQLGVFAPFTEDLKSAEFYDRVKSAAGGGSDQSKVAPATPNEGVTRRTSRTR